MMVPLLLLWAIIVRFKLDGKIYPDFTSFVPGHYMNPVSPVSYHLYLI